MTSAELRYLIAADELYDGRNGVKLTEIAEERGVSKVSVYRAAERLEKNGYIRRDEKNKVVLTEYGSFKLKEYRQIVSFVSEHLSMQCDIPYEEAYEDALGVACAFGDRSREAIAKLLRGPLPECNYKKTEAKEND